MQELAPRETQASLSANACVSRGAVALSEEGRDRRLKRVHAESLRIASFLVARSVHTRPDPGVVDIVILVEIVLDNVTRDDASHSAQGGPVTISFRPATIPHALRDEVGAVFPEVMVSSVGYR